jgi:pimeloyl-ACP methyl ester carboxylesterase
MTPAEQTEHTVLCGDQRICYLEAGPRDGPLLIFIHGWPELAVSWRHVLPHFAALGFRVVAPDMRGYGRSGVPSAPDAYRQSLLVADMLALLDILGAEKAVWIGHDWGTATVWGMASHHPERCHGVANLCVPYRTIERGVDALVPLVDRSVYPAERHPWGQWAYMRFCQQHFARVTAVLEADQDASIRAIFRRGDPARLGLPSGHVDVFRNHGWFGGADAAPDVPRDEAVLSAGELSCYVEALSRNGFAGPNSYYLNDAANLVYSDSAIDGGRLKMPVLFVAARYDITCEAVASSLAEPMKAHCSRLTTAFFDAGWETNCRPCPPAGGQTAKPALDKVGFPQEEETHRPA